MLQLDKAFEIEHGQALVDLALCDRPDGARRRLEAVTLLVKLIRPVELENKVSVNSRRVAGRIVDAGASGSALDDRVRVGTVEISDRIAVATGFVDDAVRCRQEAVVRPAPHDVAEVDLKVPGTIGEQAP